MCAIVGSFNPQKLEELIKLNSYRGEHSYSLLEYNYEENIIEKLYKGFGEFNFNLLKDLEYNSNYFIAHTQAPTTSGKGYFNIHPSESQDTLLYHNGILKEDCILELQKDYSYNEHWDTRLLHYHIEEGKDLSEIDGTFSCLHYNGDEWLLFRNEISPMFIDDDFNISSTGDKGFKPTTPNEEMKMKFGPRLLEKRYTFKTKENPYFFG